MVYYSSKLWGKTKKVVGDMEAFIAPENFNPESQPLNIVTVIDNYDNVNKAYIFSFTSVIANLFLPASLGITYRWGETIGGNDYVYDIESGTAFTAGSTKRYVIVNSTSSSLPATVPNGGIWLYARDKIYSISSTHNNYLKYIHCQNLHSVTTIVNGAFRNCTGCTGILNIPNSVTTIGTEAFRSCIGLTGSLNIPNSVTTIGNLAFFDCRGFTGTLTISNSVTTIGSEAFRNCTGLTGTLTIPNSVITISNLAFFGCRGFTGSLTIPNSVITIGNQAFRDCTGFTGIGTILGKPLIGSLAFNPVGSISEWHILSSTAPSVQMDTWGNYAKPLHVKIGATGYNVAPWTNTAIFSSIIYDL